MGDITQAGETGATGARGIFEATVKHFLAPIEPFMNDPAVAEIMINSPDEIYVEREGRLVRTDQKGRQDSKDN